MVQPLGYHTPDAGVQGFIDLPEFPFALEPRTISRWDAARYAREAYDAGIAHCLQKCYSEVVVVDIIMLKWHIYHLR